MFNIFQSILLLKYIFMHFVNQIYYKRYQNGTDCFIVSEKGTNIE